MSRAIATQSPPVDPATGLNGEGPRTSEDGRLVSEQTYWEEYYLESDVHYEWNNGRLEEKPVSDYATYLVYMWLVELLRQFLRAEPIARMIAPYHYP